MQKVFIGLFFTSLIFISSCSSVMQVLEGDDFIPERRSVEVIQNDTIIEKTLKNIANEDYILVEANLHFMAYNSLVIITGEAPTVEVMEHLYQTLKTTKNLGIKKIINKVDVMPPATSYLSKARDLMLKLQAETSLNEQEVFDPKHIKMLVTRKVVYLAGLVTEEEANYVTNQVAKTQGVEKIVRLFEYLEQRPAVEEAYYNKQKADAEQRAILEARKADLLKQQEELQRELDALGQN